MSCSNDIVVSSVNTRGLRNRDKMKDVLNYLYNSEGNIYCLQDTHWLSQENNISQFWDGEFIINGNKTNARGVAFLLKKNFEYKIINTLADQEGNTLTVDLILQQDFSIRIINLYAPNTDSPKYFDYINELVTNNPNDYLIICGDFNLILNPNLDCHNYQNINNPKARNKLLHTIQTQQLIDAFRYKYPSLQRYTWRRTKPFKQARLDFFLVTDTLIDLATSVKTVPGYRTDHSMIKLHLNINPFTRGKGTWKFNCNLLQDIQYVNIINELIENEKIQYALPIYNPSKIKEIDNNELQFTISDHLFLDTLLMQIRGETIKYASKIKKKNQKAELELIDDIDKIEKSPTLQSLTSLLDDKKIELQHLRNIRLKGEMVRSRIQWIDEGERPTKFFCALEHKNFINKTIKKLRLNNGEIITDQKQVLKEIQYFYKKLFSKPQNHNPPETNLNTLLETIETRILNIEESNKIEGLISVTELSNSLSKMNNNKTPGLDGFPVDFYKVFWIKIKWFVLRAINESYKNKILPLSMRQVIITSIPKGDKPREFLKNWRPISLLNVSYKLASSAIANRIKSVLPSIISETQTGFLQERYIGESTRLIYDIMNHCETNNKAGLLMLIDFEKAFDSISWDFMLTAFKYFNFGDSILNWIKLFNTDVKAAINQSGYLSEFFKIHRGCRQGDPISSYEFLVCAEILYLMINNNLDIKGIFIQNIEYELTQFADDTTIIMDGTEKTLQATLNTLEVFGTYSGLKMNTSKTKIIWIGRKKFCKDKLHTTHPLIWGESTFDLLGLSFTVNLKDMIKLNYSKYITQITKSITHWRKRYLTPLGKITVIKTFFLGKFIHLFTTLPTPPAYIFKEINTLFYNFLWDNKNDKIKREQISKPYNQGGLNMVDITAFIQSLKLSWIRKFIYSETKPWYLLLKNEIEYPLLLLNLGYEYTNKIMNKTQNQFWKDILLSWSTFQKKMPINKFTVLTHPLWYNPSLTKTPLMNTAWYNNGIRTVSDMIDPNGNLYSHETICTNYKVPKLDFLTYHKLNKSISKILKDIFETQTYPIIPKPSIPQQIVYLIYPPKGTKNFYQILSNSDRKIYKNSKWDQDIGYQISEQNWIYAYNICFKTINDHYLIWNQYKLLNRILGTNSLLFKMKIKTTNKCRICQDNEETLCHIFTNCQQVIALWEDLSTWITHRVKVNIIFTPITIILGYMNTDNNQIPINSIILSAKSYIFWCVTNSKPPNITQLQNRIKTMILQQKGIYQKNIQQEKYIKSWHKWQKLTD